MNIHVKLGIINTPLFLANLLLIIGIYSAASNHSEAGILINTSRVIFDADRQEKTISLANTNSYPVLTQLWIDNGTEGPEFSETPYLVLPTISKLEAKQTISARIIANGLNLASDRESLHWLNIYELPAVSQSLMQSDHIQFAIHTQLKIIHRPSSLSEPQLDKLVEEMAFKKIADSELFTIEIENKSAYYISIIDIHIIKDGNRVDFNNEIDNSLPPYSTKAYASKSNLERKAEDKLEIHFNLIDDHGAAKSYQIII